ncbi:pilus assembly protein [Aquisalimonas asiatica]|uniref:Type IV pilus assembly protein PilY1 n=1 Tax=Aquisalimonas asiatica TaxID=406100 RepID=A0A1H8S3R0_9GAMM|nr:PilC/PilY family type IV pilus protein [Aquisalimonas asiatica]SEO72958.1 type IV pilus assembly protein PilY1 [Aquisalimonas asiatica]
MSRDFSSTDSALKLSRLAATAAVMSLGSTSLAHAEIAQKPLFMTGPGKPPNILLIPDTSESMQEGPDGRLAMDRDDPACQPGPDLEPDIDFDRDPDADHCPAGARNPGSKASIVKRVGLDLVDRYQGLIDLGLLSYQQAPASNTRDDFNDGGTVRWRLVERAIDVRFSQDDELGGDWDEDFDGSWDSDTKRFRVPHPTDDNLWIFFNDGVPGYLWNTGADGAAGVPEFDRTEFYWRNNPGGADFDNMTAYESLQTWNPGDGQFDTDSSLWLGNEAGSFQVFLVDSQRQRNIDSWGQRAAFLQMNQLEWRSTTSPGLGYLHVPIGGTNADGSVDTDHWDQIRTKLQPQRHDWDGSGNPMVDPEWPLIASGLTPLQGTMRTARDYFLGERQNFGSAQGNPLPQGTPDIPESCDVNAAIWVTDGLPSVSADGTERGDDFDLALEEAEEAIRSFYEDTEEEFGEGVSTYIVGFALPPGLSAVTDESNPLDILAEAGGTGSAFDATSEEGLDAAMNQIFSQVVQEAQGSAGAVAANTTSLQAGAAIFQAGFDASDWSGELQAFRVSNPQSEETGEDADLVSDSPAWDAESQLPSAPAREILTWVPDEEADGDDPWTQGTTTTFDYDNLGEPQQAYLDANDDRGPDRVAWLRGDSSNEGVGADDLRSRINLLGDIVHSEPLFVHSENFGYSQLDSGGDSYAEARQSWQDTSPKVLVAANDGKLHAFDGRLPCDSNGASNGIPCSSQGGTELFSVVPNSVYSKLTNLTDPDHSREYVLDGSPQLGHVYDRGSWRRIAVVAQGRGGSGVMAVDIDSREVLWEIDDSHSDLLGAVIGDPVLAKAPSGDWITIIPNGPGSEDGRAGFLILDTVSGELLNTWIPEGESNTDDNGMFSPVTADMNGDFRADRVYAGDLQGNLWRLDLTDQNPGSWDAPGFLNEDPLFQTDVPAGEEGRQPITARPALARGSGGELGIFFGTGQFFAVGDDNVDQSYIQSLYGIRDNDQAALPSRDQLLEQEIFWEGDDFGFELRATTDNTLEGERGWVMDLVSPNEGFEGERVTEGALVRGGDRVVFSTLIPTADEDPCQPGGGTGWIMEFNAFTGERLERSPWDLSGDGFGEESFADTSEGSLPTSGIRSPVGIPSQPRVMEPAPDDPDQGREYKIPAGSDGEIWDDMPDEERSGYSWRTWRQIR